MNASSKILHIRRAVDGDATVIVRVRQQAVLSKAGSHYDPAILDDWADATGAEARAARIARNIANPDFVVLVAETAGDIIGFAMAALAKNELQALYVKPNPIGNVGRSLLSAVEKIAFKTAPFLVCDASLNAASFYKAHGYIEEGRKDYVARPGGVTSCVVQMRKHRPKPDPA